ncbi:MAG: acetyl-CoA carboxylase carboxyltransferase subunit alpha [Lentisphaeria bacterium]
MSRRHVLDFERPIYELEQKVDELERFGRLNDVDVDEGLERLQEQIDAAKEEIYQQLTPWQRVQLARHIERPYTLDYIERICTDFLELNGDRHFSNDEALVGGFAKIDGQHVMIIGQQKGRNPEERQRRHHGSMLPEGYRKALRLMKLADKAGLPIICLIDTQGAFPGIDSEERHIGEAIAVNLREMFTLTVPVIAIVIGEGGSGGALGIGIGNRVLLMENAYYSVITPEGCAAILWKDANAKEKAAEALKLTSHDLLKLELIDDIIPEPEGGANQDYDAAATAIKTAILKQLQQLDGKSADELRTERYERFRRLGTVAE